MAADRYPLHQRSEADVDANASVLFAHLDEHNRLAGHMAKPSLMMAGANGAPEFRLESYARVLRTYWRFLALGFYTNEEEAFFWEAVMFGWHEKPFGNGRIRFLLSEKPTDGFPEDVRVVESGL